MKSFKFCFVLVFCIAKSMVAQQAPARDSVLQGELKEVVVSGTLRETSRLASPIPVETFTQTFFRKSVAPTLFESLNLINGVQPQINCNVCNTGDIHINGMEGPYTMVLVDGMPIVSALSTVYGLSGIPNSLIERVEVVKGPASTLYGSEAVAGLINIITKHAPSAPKFSAEVNGSTYGEFSADVASKFTMKRASTLLSASYFDYSFRTDLNHDNFTDIALQKRVSVFNKWQIQGKRNDMLNFALRYHFENRWGGEMQWEKRWSGSDSIYGETIQTQRAEAFGSYGFNIKAEQFKIDFSYNYHLQKSFYGTVRFDAQQHLAFAQLRWFKTIGRHYLLAGIPLRFTYYDDNTVGTQTLQQDGAVKNYPSHTLLSGIFVQHEGNFHRYFTLLTGLRFDYHQQHGSIFSPRMSVKIPISKSHVIRLSGGNGYRVVNLFTEEHAALTGAREVVVKHKLKPEQSWNGNLNYASTIQFKAGFLKLDVNGFYTYFSNKIVPDYTTPGKIIFDNIQGYAISRGFSVSGDLFFDNSFKLSLGATVLDVYKMEKSGTQTWQKVPQILAAPFSGTFSVGYCIPKIKVQIDWSGKLNSPMPLPVVLNDFRPAKSPWFCLMNIQFSRKFKYGIEVYAGVKNLLNFKPKDPLLRPFDPFDKHINEDNPNGYTFDTSYNYTSLQGVRGFFGFKWIWE